MYNIYICIFGSSILTVPYFPSSSAFSVQLQMFFRVPDDWVADQQGQKLYRRIWSQSKGQQPVIAIERIA